MDGLRVHAWVLVRPGPRQVEEHFFIEPTTGMNYELNTTFYNGIESVWNDFNYWVNIQDCSEGLDTIDYNLKDITRWEHLLPGEPLEWREFIIPEMAEEEDIAAIYVNAEKHLDMPMYWSMRIAIPHDSNIMILICFSCVLNIIFSFSQTISKWL